MTATVLEGLEAEVRTLSSGSTSVVDVWHELRLNWDGDSVAVFEVTLNEPTGPTWPAEEFRDLRFRARQLLALGLPPGISLQLTYTSVGSPEEQAGDFE